ncbi:MAG TPA: nickel-responsive transcriptional regulator NikR [Candidatus Hydrogenedentes bacterium]|nr:nickel-responsive transcriptional regulator NikR [Candidatus Hydrogenedentota bacterium]
MSELARLSFSIEKPLLDRLERMLEEGNYGNRSEFIRDMIRDRLVAQEWEKNEEALGTVTILFDHHARNLTEKLIELQHDFDGTIMATTHMHLTHHLCAEMIMIRGRAGQIRALADALHQLKGVLHATLSMSSTGQALA